MKALFSRITLKGRRRRVALRYGIPVLGLLGVCLYEYFKDGFNPGILRVALFFGVGFFYYRFGPKVFGQPNFILFLPTVFTLWASFLLWDPAEHLPFGSDAEYPHLAGLAFGAGVGGMVMLARASEEDTGEMSWKALWYMRHYFVSFAIVAVAGYSLFLFYAFAMYQVFTEGNYLFALLAACSIVAVLAVAHNQAKAKNID